MELYVNAANQAAPPRGQRATNAQRHDSDPRQRRSQQALLDLIDQDDPAWPSIAAVLREMNDADVDLNEVSYEIAAKLGAHRHRLTMTDASRTSRDERVYHKITQLPTGISVVYYFRRGDLIKIGTTKDPAIRFGQLMPDEILAVEPGNGDLETARHHQFDHLYVRGEYFRTAPELLEHCRQLRGEHGDPDPAWVTTATPGTRRGARSFPLPPLTSHETVTAAEASRRLGLKAATVSKWVSRGLISPVDWNEAGRRVFYVEHLAALRDRNRRGKLARSPCKIH